MHVLYIPQRPPSSWAFFDFALTCGWRFQWFRLQKFGLWNFLFPGFASIYTTQILVWKIFVSWSLMWDILLSICRTHVFFPRLATTWRDARRYLPSLVPIMWFSFEFRLSLSCRYLTFVEFNRKLSGVDPPKVPRVLLPLVLRPESNLATQAALCYPSEA